VGGAAGLASSAGQRLAEQRPTSFVVFGLFGVAVLLLAGMVLIMVTIGRIGPRRLSRLAAVATAVVAVIVLTRGIALEILLATDAGGLRTAIGPLETRWSLAVWNPWFALGGALFMLTAVQALRPARGRVDSSR